MIMHRQVVVNAQFEDRIRARICAGDSLKRAGLFIHSLKMAKVVQMVSSSVAVLCSRVANEEATGRSLAPKWSILGAYEGFLGRGFLGKEAQNQSKTDPFGSQEMPKVVQTVPSSVAVLCSRVANEEATGRSPKRESNTILDSMSPRTQYTQRAPKIIIKI